MGGKPCIRGMARQRRHGRWACRRGTRDEILREYPYLEAEDIADAFSYAAWRAEKIEVGYIRVVDECGEDYIDPSDCSCP
jgi:uncharacterized protein (DUF433 family)